MHNEPLEFINRTDALRELDQLLINRPLMPERALIMTCKRRLMELPIIQSAQLPPKKFKKCPRCGYEENHYHGIHPNGHGGDDIDSRGGGGF